MKTQLSETDIEKIKNEYRRMAPSSGSIWSGDRYKEGYVEALRFVLRLAHYDMNDFAQLAAETEIKREETQP